MFLDLTKLALDGNEEYSSGEELKNLAPVGLLAAAPFGANIGRRRMKHFDKGELAENIRELKRKVRAGDIVLSGSKELGPAKLSISLATGNPKGYHIGVARKNNSLYQYESHPYSGYGTDYSDHTQNIQILRAKDKTQVKNILAKSKQFNSAALKFKNSVKNKLISYGHSAEEAEEQAMMAVGRLYRDQQGVMAGIKDLFTPKLKGSIEQDLSAKKQLDDTQRFIKGHRGYSTDAAKAIDAANNRLEDYQKNSKLVKLREKLVEKIPAYRSFVENHPELSQKLHLNPYSRQVDVKKLMNKIIPSCAGGVCSTVPAVFGGKEIIPGKGLTEILPADYLKSDAFVPVARFNGAMPESLGGKILHKTLEHAPMLARIGAATGLGVASYAGIKRHLARKAEQENTKVAKSLELKQLIKAKKMSDQKDYVHKNEVLRALLNKNPKAFKVDSHLNSGYVGITHIKSGFKIHAPKSIVPSSLIHPDL